MILRGLDWRAFPALLAISLVVTFRNTAWLGEWNYSFEAVGLSTSFTAPLCATVGAAYAFQYGRRRDLFESFPRFWAVVPRCALITFVQTVAAFLVTMLIVVAANLQGPHGGPISMWPIALALGVLASCCSLGACLGIVLPNILAVILAAPVLFALPLATHRQFRQVAFPLEGTDSLTGLAYRDDVCSAIVFLHMAIAVLAPLILIAHLRWRRGLLGALALCVLVVPVLQLAHSGVQRFHFVGEDATLCVGWHPRVCLAPSNARSLATTLAAVRAGQRALKGANVEGPELFMQNSSAQKLPDAVGVVRPRAVGEDAATFVGQVAVRPRACRAYFETSAPPPDLSVAMSLLAAWVSRRVDSGYSTGAERIDAWIDDSQRSDPWIRETYSQLMSCELSKVRTPSGVL